VGSDGVVLLRVTGFSLHRLWIQVPLPVSVFLPAQSSYVGIPVLFLRSGSVYLSYDLVMILRARPAV